MKSIVLALLLATSACASFPSPEEIRDQSVEILDAAADTLVALRPAVQACPETKSLCAEAKIEFERASQLIALARRALLVGESAAAEIGQLLASVERLVVDVKQLTRAPADPAQSSPAP